MTVTVDVLVAQGVGMVPASAQFCRWVRLVSDAFSVKEGEVAIRVVDEAEGARLNQRWRGQRRATNVLSFPVGDMPTVPGEPRHLGDLVLCAPVLRREAGEYGKPEADHWAHLVVHGALHLFGMDHQDAAEAQRMEALETRLLAELGIADPYQGIDQAME